MQKRIIINFCVPLFDINEFTQQLERYCEKQNVLLETDLYNFEYKILDFIFRVNGPISTNNYSAVLPVKDINVVWDLIDYEIDKRKDK